MVLIRGINVGGKNIVPMSELKACLEDSGFKNVKTYIASGNVILRSDKNSQEVRDIFEEEMPKKFVLSGEK